MNHPATPDAFVAESGTAPTPHRARCAGSRHRAALYGTLALVLLQGCSSYGPQSLATGTPQAEVLQRLGPPTAAGPLGADAAAPITPGAAQRLEYARGPAGKHTYLLDFDAAGLLLGWTQVLTEARFNEIRVGMSAQQVRERIGRPSQERPLPFQSQQVWSYRYETPFCRWFQIGLDPQGRVADTSYGPDPLCMDNARGNRR